MNTVEIPLWMIQSAFGFALVQLIAGAAWAVRMHLQMNSLVAFKAKVEEDGPIGTHDLAEIKLQQAMQRQQTEMIVSAISKLEGKVDTLIEKVAKQDGRSGRGS